MPIRKLASDNDGDGSEDNNTPPPTKKAKTSSKKKDCGAQSATLASETRPRTVSSKQAALSNFFSPPLASLGLSGGHR
jgi:hypothetical protein